MRRYIEGPLEKPHDVSTRIYARARGNQACARSVVMSYSEATPDGTDDASDPLAEWIAVLSERLDPVPESVKDAAKALFSDRYVRPSGAQSTLDGSSRDAEEKSSSTRS